MAYAASRVLSSRVKTASQLCEDKAKDRHSIVTLSADIDEVLLPGVAILGGTGGVRLGQVTELVGPAGCGKTNICLQLALNVQLHNQLGGAEGETLYIDTEGSFSASRLEELADHLQLLGEKILFRDKSDLAKPLNERVPKPKFADCYRDVYASVEAKKLLQCVHVLRVTSLQQLVNVVRNVESIMKPGGRLERVKLVIIDSLAFHFRYPVSMSNANDPQQAAGRARTLSDLGTNLHKLAHNTGLAVVVTNHVTGYTGMPNFGSGGTYRSGSGVTTVRRAGIDAERENKPALGDAWASVPNCRLFVRWDGAHRVVLVHKHLLSPLCAVTFGLFALGIRNETAPRLSSLPSAPGPDRGKAGAEFGKVVPDVRNSRGEEGTVKDTAAPLESEFELEEDASSPRKRRKET